MTLKKIRNICFFVFFVLSIVFLSHKMMYAYLIDTDIIKTTFVMGELVDDLTNDFVLKEHEALDSDKNGVYELGDNEVISNSYNVFPGVNIPKDPFVRIRSLNDRAYFYVEVVGESDDTLTWDLNDNWMKTTLKGKNNGIVYVYKGNSTDAIVLTRETVNNLVVYILDGIDGSENGGIVVSEDFSTENAVNLSFYSYLVQANGFDNYIDAFESCF